MKKVIKNHLFLFLLFPFFLGIFTSFSLPPYNFILINFITFPMLLFIVFKLKESKKKIYSFFKVGWIFGFGYFLSNLYWITYSLTFYEDFKIFIPIALILIPAFLGIFYGLIIALLFKLDFKKKITAILIFSLIFSIIEFLRGNILGGFPWNLIAFSWSFSTSFLQILSFIGTYSFNLISITIFTLPFVFIFKNYKKIQLGIFFTLLFIIGTNYIYGFKVINNKNKSNLNYSSQKIKIISPKISIDKFINNPDEKSILIDLIKLSNPKKNIPTIFIWPEGALTGIYFDELSKYSNLFSSNFSNNHLIIMGINTQNSIKNTGQIYNSMIAVDNNLQLLAKYNKNKLVPFGEFFPFEKLFKKVGLKKLSYGYESFSSGKERKIISINNKIININFLPLICYEIIYSGNINPNDKSYNLIINLSEDGWFGNSIGPFQHFTHSVFRAIEEGKNIIRSANNGISAYVDSNGEIINKLESTERGVIEVNNFTNSKKTLFSRVGNKMFFYFILFYIILIFFINKKET